MSSMKDSGWRLDEEFKEFGCYDEGGSDGLDDPWSSGFNLIGAGGFLVNENVDEGEPPLREGAVLFHLQGLDTGQVIEGRLTPDAARQMSARLTEWADAAEAGLQDVEQTIEDQRAAWHRLKH